MAMTSNGVWLLFALALFAVQSISDAEEEKDECMRETFECQSEFYTEIGSAVSKRMTDEAGSDADYSLVVKELCKFWPTMKVCLNEKSSKSCPNLAVDWGVFDTWCKNIKTSDPKVTVGAELRKLLLQHVFQDSEKYKNSTADSGVAHMSVSFYLMSSMALLHWWLRGGVQ